MVFKGSLIGSILIAQILVTCVVAACLTLQDYQSSLSALVGGLICVIPNMYLARKISSNRTADADELTKTIYAAEFGKLFITAALFAGVFATQKWVQPVALLAGFGIAQLTHWITPMVIQRAK